MSNQKLRKSHSPLGAKWVDENGRPAEVVPKFYQQVHSAKFLMGCLISFEILARILHETLVNFVVFRILIMDGFHRSGIKTVDH